MSRSTQRNALTLDEQLAPVGGTSSIRHMSLSKTCEQCGGRKIILR
jgi:hypothetical protein